MRRLGPFALCAALAVGLSPVHAARPRVVEQPTCVQVGAAQPCLGPGRIRQAYDVSAPLARGITGKGRTIAIIVSFGSPTLRSDLHSFDQAFGLPDPDLQILTPLGTTTQSDAGWQGETTLDVEWAHVMAPGAAIVVMVSPVDETEGVQGLPQFLALERYVLQHHLADVISQSWAATEDTLLDTKGRAEVAAYDAFYKSATKQGISIVSGSGDDGAGGIDLTLRHLYPHRAVQFPASDPYVLGIGGTRLSVTSGGAAERVWPRAGGGYSRLFREPAYQRALPAATQQALHGRRGVPDIALNAAKQSPVPILRDGRWLSAAGTSAATPQWAGIIALADQAAGHDLGDLHAQLYKVARTSRYHTDFHDITQGELRDPPGVPSSTRPLTAGPGWDPASGLGTPNVNELLNDVAHTS